MNVFCVEYFLKHSLRIINKPKLTCQTFHVEDVQEFLTLDVTMSGSNCNTIFDVLTSKMPNADQSKQAFVCGGDFVLIKSELQNEYDKILIYGPSFSRTWVLNSASHNVPSAT